MDKGSTHNGWCGLASYSRRLHTPLCLLACFVITLITLEPSLQAQDRPGIKITGSLTDLAIDGAGWFILRSSLTGELALTRHGAFELDSQRRLVSQDGLFVQGLHEGLLQDLWLDPIGEPPTSDPLAWIQSYSWTESGQLMVEMSDGSRFQKGQIALYKLQHPEHLIRRSYRRYIGVEVAEPSATPTTPGKEGTGNLIAGALSTESEPFRLETLPGSGIAARGMLTRTGVPTELAIRGAGVFLVRDPVSGAFEATRAGCFLVDREGYLITYDRWRVQGWSDPAMVKEGDIQINGKERPIISDPESLVSSYHVAPDGKILVTLSDGSAFTCGQIFHYQIEHPIPGTLSGLNRLPVRRDQVSSDRGSWWLEIGSLERVHLSPQLAAQRKQWTLRLQGALSETGNPTDLAVSGVGWFVVRDPASDSKWVTRVGHFQLNDEGYLVTKGGYRLQGFSGPDLKFRGDVRINAEGRPAAFDSTATLTGFSITRQGRLNVRLSDGSEYVRGQITLQTFREEFALRSIGDGLFAGWEAAIPDRNEAPGSLATGTLQSGALESPEFASEIAGTNPHGFRLLISGEPGARAVIERSSNLVDWTPWQALQLTEAELEISDQDAPASSAATRFYRLTETSP